jgi:Uma2 family endonuclease
VAVRNLVRKCLELLDGHRLIISPPGYHDLMAVTGTLLSVAEFARLPQPAGGVRQELHHGELVELPPVKKLHTKLQKRLVGLLEARLNPAEHGVDKEFPFRPAPEYEVWVADVALFSLALWEQTADDDYFRGVPAIVIEVLSPSNSASEMLEREEICLRHGGRELWLVDPGRESVKVIHADGRSIVHDAESVIESSALGGSITMRDIFAR